MTSRRCLPRKPARSAWTGNERMALSAEGEAALSLLDAKAEGDLDPATRKQRLDAALERLVELES